MPDHQLLIICGDFNYKWNHVPFLIDITNNTITFKRNVLGNIMQPQTDHILINKIYQFKIKCISTKISDHVLLILAINMQPNTERNNEQQTNVQTINKKSAIKIFSSFYLNYKKHIYQKQILTKSRIRLNQSLIYQYDQVWLINKSNQLKLRKEFFKLLQTTIIINKREGGIFNCYQDLNNNIQFCQKVYRNCFQQLSLLLDSAEYQPMPISSLTKLNKQDIENLEQMMTYDKAISYYCITYQLVKNCNWDILSDIWNAQIFNSIQMIGWGQLIPLNKVYPNIPRENQFRLLVILSPIYKFIELQFYSKQNNYLQNNILKEQTGFVKGYGTQISISILFDMIKNIKAEERYMILFIDFSNVYHTIKRIILYQILEENQILIQEETQFLIGLHSRILYINPCDLQGKISFKNGVPKESPISPYLFIIYMDRFLINLLIELNYEIKILGYANNLAFLVKHTKLSSEWKLFINKQKSAVMRLNIYIENQIFQKFGLLRAIDIQEQKQIIKEKQFKKQQKSNRNAIIKRINYFQYHIRWTSYSHYFFIQFIYNLIIIII